MASRSKTDLHPKLTAAFEKAVAKWETLYPNLAKPFLTATYRSNEEQNSLYAIGRTVKGAKVTNARAGQSAHNYMPSFAFDVAFIGWNKKLDWNATLFKKFATLVHEADPTVEWGGNWKFTDLPHFQIRDWETLKK